MRKTLRKILIVVLVLIAGIFSYAATRPAEMYIAREISISASPEKVFPLLNNSKKANEWMPWQKVDPQVVMNYSGPEEGVGSASSWDSKGQMGTGNAEVVESIPNQKVVTKLTYTKPMEMSQMAEMSIVADGNGSKVRWSVTGKNSIIGRVACLFMNLDKVVGGQFEEGLANLKKMAEAQ